MTELHERQATLLGILALKVLKRLGTDTALIDEDGSIRNYRSVRVGDVLLLEKQADGKMPKRIDCFAVDVQNFDAAKALLADSGVRYKLDPQCLLFQLAWKHNAEPPDLDLAVVQPPELWFDHVWMRLLGVVCRHDTRVREKLNAAMPELAGLTAAH